MSVNQSLNLSNLLVNLDPELKEAIWKPHTVKENYEIINIFIEKVTEMVRICENPQNELQLINRKQINFMVPVEMRDSRDPQVYDIKRFIHMCIKKYTSELTDVNMLIKLAREQIKSLHEPFKKLQKEVIEYGEDFQSNMNNLAGPLKDKLDGVDTLKSKDRDKEKEFKKGKENIIKSLNDFGEEAKKYNGHYKEINENIKTSIEKLLDKFDKLLKPVKECYLMMKNGIIEFENSNSEFKDLKNIKRMRKAIEKINENTKNMQDKLETIKQLYEKNEAFVIEEQELSENMNKMREICKILKKKAEDIDQKINELRDKYKEKPIDPKGCNPKEANTQNVIDGVKNGTESYEKAKEPIVDKIEEIPDFKPLLQQFRLDILFIMDITSSMGEYLAQAKKGLIEMVDKIKASCPSVDIYLGFVGYRDFNDLDLGQKYEDFDFTKQYDVITNGIKDVKADGGGDVPEDLAGAFDMSIKKSWGGKTKFAILVTDAPCHGEKYQIKEKINEDTKDNYPEGDRENRNIEDQIKYFAKNEISLYCIKIEDLTTQMLNIFQTIYNENKPENSECKFVIEESNKIIDVAVKNCIEIYSKNSKDEEDEKK